MNWLSNLDGEAAIDPREAGPAGSRPVAVARTLWSAPRNSTMHSGAGLTEMGGFATVRSAAARPKPDVRLVAPLAEERIRCAGTVTPSCGVAAHGRANPPRRKVHACVVEADKQQKDADPPGGGLASCFIRIPQSRMTSEEQRRSRLGEATPHRGVPLTAPAAQPEVATASATVCATRWNDKHSQTRNFL
jgi:murein DD-endopeptidase MepM/ murein hydrolase activator NlpD